MSCLDLLSLGYDVHLLADGVSSSNKEEIPYALERIRQAGAIVGTSESVAFQLQGKLLLLPWRCVHSSFCSSRLRKAELQDLCKDNQGGEREDQGGPSSAAPTVGQRAVRLCRNGSLPDLRIPR